MLTRLIDERPIPKQRHPFMGLLTCARCDCAMTAERKKGKYTYYRCTGFHGSCGNSYIREEHLATLLGTVVTPIQITPEIADDIAAALRSSEGDGERRRQAALRQLEQRRRAATVKLDRGYTTITSAGRSRKSSGRGNRRSGRRNRRPLTVSAPTSSSHGRVSWPRPLRF
jgi:hypothetical protein